MIKITRAQYRKLQNLLGSRIQYAEVELENFDSQNKVIITYPAYVETFFTEELKESIDQYHPAQQLVFYCE